MNVMDFKYISVTSILWS